MRDWMDFNGDGEVDDTEHFLAEEMLCVSREEHEALFGDAGDFSKEIDEEIEDELMYAGLDKDELELMNPDERRNALDDVGLDADDFDFD